jgi:hypothetical protein
VWRAWGKANLLRGVVGGIGADVDYEVGREVADHAAVFSVHRRHRLHLQPDLLLRLCLRLHCLQWWPRKLSSPLLFFTKRDDCSRKDILDEST